MEVLQQTAILIVKNKPPREKALKEYRTTGFSEKTNDESDRLIGRDGRVNVRKSGMGFLAHFSVFHYLVNIPWWKFNVLIILSYAAVHALYGLLYTAVGVESIGVESRGHLEDLMQGIYFSAQTFSTVGFGRLNPQNHIVNLISMSEMLVGMMYLALAAGLLFARFSRPVSKIVFSKNALISPYKAGKGLMIRLTNAKENLLIDVRARVLLSTKKLVDGQYQRKFYQLNLELASINMLALSWTIVHPIDEGSPLHNLTEEEIESIDPEILVLIRGYNNTFSQDIHSQTSYKYEDLVWGAKFTPIFRNRRGQTIVDVHKIDEYYPVEKA